MLIEHEPQKEKKKEIIEIPQRNIDYAYSRIKAWVNNPQTGVRLKMMFDPDGNECYVVFSFQHPSASIKAYPLSLWDPYFKDFFDQAEKKYYDYAMKADNIANDLKNDLH